MTDLALALDHIGAAVASLDAGADLYRRLGFQLTPRSIHSGSIEPGGPVVPWGSGNHCAMLKDGYLEVIGVVDAEKYSTVKTLLTRYEGVHTVAIRCADADRAYDVLSRRNPGVLRPSILQREVTLGGAHEETHTARFQNIYFSREAFPEARFIVIEHVTPELLWRPELLAHPNGAEALIGVQICVDDEALEAAASRLASTFGAVDELVDDGLHRLALARGALHVLARSRMRSLAPLPGSPPCVVGFTVQVRSVTDTARLLATNGIPFSPVSEAAIAVVPASAFGTVISFTSDPGDEGAWLTPSRTI